IGEVPEPVYVHVYYISRLQPLLLILRVVQFAGAVELQEAPGTYSTAAYYIAGQYIHPICAALYYLGKCPVHISHAPLTYLHAIYQASHLEVVASTLMT